MFQIFLPQTFFQRDVFHRIRHELLVTVDGILGTLLLHVFGTFRGGILQRREFFIRIAFLPHAFFVFVDLLTEQPAVFFVGTVAVVSLFDFVLLLCV